MECAIRASHLFFVFGGKLSELRLPAIASLGAFDAESRPRQRKKPFFFDRLFSFFADTVLIVFDAAESPIDFAKLAEG